MKNFKHNKGQVLIEAIVAIAVVSFIMAGIVAALITAVNNSTFSKNQNLATNYAQEGIDIARDIKDNNYVSFVALGNGEFCLAKGATTFSSAVGCQLINNIFRRIIYVNQDGQDKTGRVSCEQNTIFVASIVSWNDSRCNSGGRCHKVELNSCFSNFNQAAPL